MKKSKFSESQIVGILKQQENGESVADILLCEWNRSDHVLSIEEQVLEPARQSIHPAR